MDEINVKVIKLDSVKTQLPYDYYSLPFCKPEGGIVEVDENLGEVLSGDQIENSPYNVLMKQPETCKVLCVKDYTDEEFALFADKIEDEYRVNWLLDNIPAATKYYTVNVAPRTEDGKASERAHRALREGLRAGLRGPQGLPQQPCRASSTSTTTCASTSSTTTRRCSRRHCPGPSPLPVDGTHATPRRAALPAPPLRRASWASR